MSIVEPEDWDEDWYDFPEDDDEDD